MLMDLSYFFFFFVSVLPRVVFDKFHETDIADVLTYAESRDQIAELLVQTCKGNGLNGVVLEVWFQLAGRVKDKHLILLVEHLGNIFIYKIVT